MVPREPLPASSRRKLRVRLWWPVAVYMAAIFAVSSMPNPPLPSQFGDKVGHGLAYAGLGLVALRAMSGGTVVGLGAPAAVGAWSLSVAYGLTDEWHQRFVPGRRWDLLDWIADAAGAASGILLGWAFGIIVRSRRTPVTRPAAQ